MARYRRSVFIVSTGSAGAYKLLKILRYLHVKNVCYWVIGGDLLQLLGEHSISIKPYLNARTIIVEGKRMEEALKSYGLNNVITLPNFRHVDCFPIKREPDHKIPVRFVFLSRIREDKGCGYINKAAEILNEEGFSKSYLIDFYGIIDQKYKERFLSEVRNIPNIQYKGFLDLTDKNNYSVLSAYDAMVFPTYFPSEGFPGAFIDAFIAGIPIIASDWNLNSEIIKQDVTGIIVPHCNETNLAMAMKDVIGNRKKYWGMGYNCMMKSMEYDIDEVITYSLLKQMGIKV